MSTDRILGLIDEEIARLKQVRQLIAGTAAASSFSNSKPAKPGRKRRHLSAAARKKIADAQRLRWASRRKPLNRTDPQGAKALGTAVRFKTIFSKR